MPDTGDGRSYAWWHETVIAVLLVIVLQFAGWLVPGFLKLQSQLLLSRQLWEFAILALGMTLIIITGGIDLSVGSTMGLSAVVFGGVHKSSGSLMAASLACLATGLCCGAVNGALVSRLRLHPLIVTLATFAAYRGIAEGWSQGHSYSRFGDAFSDLARGSWLGVPLPGAIFVLMATGFAVFLSKTPYGRFLYAIGHNERAAKFSASGFIPRPAYSQDWRHLFMWHDLILHRPMSARASNWMSLRRWSSAEPVSTVAAALFRGQCWDCF